MKPTSQPIALTTEKHNTEQKPRRLEAAAKPMCRKTERETDSGNCPVQDRLLFLDCLLGGACNCILGHCPWLVKGPERSSSAIPVCACLRVSAYVWVQAVLRGDC